MHTFNLEPNEEIILERRKHWWEYVFPLGSAVFNALLPLLFLGFIGVFSDSSFSDKFPGNAAYLFAFLYALWLLVMWVNVAVFATNIYLDVLVVTNRRIIDIEQHGLFSRRVSSVRFERIQDATVNVHGIIPTLLRFGSLSIQTAGEQKEFVIKNIPDPYAVKDFIMREHNRAMEKNTGKPPEPPPIAS